MLIKGLSKADEATSIAGKTSRVQHATTAEAAEQIMLTEKLGNGSSTGGATFSRVAKNPGKAPSAAELQELGVVDAKKVIEFDVKPSELKLDELGDVRLPDPTDLRGRNATELDVTE